MGLVFSRKKHMSTTHYRSPAQDEGGHSFLNVTKCVQVCPSHWLMLVVVFVAVAFVPSNEITRTVGEIPLPRQPFGSMIQQLI